MHVAQGFSGRGSFSHDRLGQTRWEHKAATGHPASLARGGTSLQYFTFHRKAERLRAQVRAWQIAVSAEAVVMIMLGLVASKPANYIVLGITPVYFAFVWWLYSRPLRRRHTLTASALKLVDKSGKAFVIPRDQIRSVERFTGPLPRGVASTGYKYIPEEDTLYILPDIKSLVAITLKSPVTARLTPRIIVEFTRVVCLVDEPEAFIAAVMPDAKAAPGGDGSPTEEVVRAETSPTTDKAQVVIQSPMRSLSDPGPATIELCDLTKRFGNYTAVDRLTLRVAPGEIFAFLGSNGAGKSTTVKMLAGLLRPTSGRILIGGEDPWRDLKARRLVGYVPDSPMLYENLTAQEHLWLVGGLYDLPEEKARARAREVLEQVGLERHADQPIRSYSLGMKRKLAIASALMHRPPILLLDEATNGLDPRAAREIKDFLSDAARSGTTIFLTTHLLDVVSELAHRVAIIDQGVLKACGTLSELRRAFGRPNGSLEELFLLATDRNRKEAMAQ